MNLALISIIALCVLVICYLAYERYIIKQKHAALQQTVTSLREESHQLNEKHNAQMIAIKAFEDQVCNYQTESTHNEALLSTFTNVSYDYVLVLDDTHTLIAHNQSALALFEGINPIGKHLVDVLDAPDLDDIIQRSTTEDETLEQQFVLGKRYYRARTQVIRYGDNQFLIGIAIQDITQLVRLNRARRDMVANISHELRTPITKIRFVIDSLFHEDDRPKRKASITSLREISTEVGALEDVVQELLDLSMIESGQSIMKLVDESVQEMMDVALERLHEKLEHKQITVVQNIPDKMIVLCDRDHIRRVFTNLISNAIKWSPPKDVITVTAVTDGEDVIISVFDNGPGVPDNQRERIFERFYQVDTARSGREGSGLGLAICKHIIEAHGGRVWAEGNSQGNGGRFLFTLLSAQPLNDDVYMDKAQHDFVMDSHIDSVNNSIADASINES
ncbi:MAG: ATP-binding protein [Phototrophicaceae bacterium]